MFKREIWYRFTSSHSGISKFQKSELGKSIPNFPLKHVITIQISLLPVQISLQATSYGIDKIF